MRLIDADALKEDLTRFYDNEVTARKLIDEQPTIQPEPHWIPVTERLPKDGRQVLVYAMSVHYALAKYDEMRDADGTYKKQWVTFDAWKPYYTIKDVIAWIPLPEPYKGGDNMSVIVKGMEMPERCGACFLRVGGCKQRIYMEQRPKGCPLIELPPHGRLIDADELIRELASEHVGGLEAIKKYTNADTWTSGLHTAWRLIDDASTVIEAEGEKDGR